MPLDRLYTDPGATAADACAGSVVPSSSGTVNTAITGDYTITYTATDPNSNSSTSYRVVSVQGALDPVAITSGPTPTASTNAQGTNFTLSVAVAGSPFTCQWYTVEGGNAVVTGATSGTNSFTANPVLTPGLADKYATNHYYVIVTGGLNSVTSSIAKVVITLDTKPPVLVLTTPAKNIVYGATGKPFSVTGSVTDTATAPAKGNVAHVYYYYVNLNTPNTSPTYEATITNKLPANVPSAKGFNVLTNPPPLPGTNTIYIWPVDLAGNIGKGATNTFFYSIQTTFILNKLGDGTGAVTFKNKLGDKVNTSNVVYFLAGDIQKPVNLNVGETYTLSYTPDRTTNNIKNLPSVISVLSNAPGMDANAGTNTIKKYIGTDILVASNMTATFEFDRDRFKDMAGNYNAVFTADTNNPSVTSSRYLHMTVTPTRKVSGYLKDSLNQKDIFTPVTPGAIFTADGHLHLTTPGGITIDGSLAWSGSEDTTGIKQFTGSASNNTFAASVVADKEDGGNLTTIEYATMSIPGGSDPTDPGGSGFATIKSAPSGVVTANYTLSDNDKQTVAWPLKISRSGNVPQWIITKTGVLFGTINVTNGLTVSAPNLSWIHNATFVAYPTLFTSGFINSPFAATCSPYNGTGLTGTYTVSLSGGNLTNTITQSIPLNGVAVPSFTSTVGPVTLAKVDINGKATVAFLDGLPSKHKTTAVGVVLQNANNGAGFFIRRAFGHEPTNSGSLLITP